MLGHVDRAKLCHELLGRDVLKLDFECFETGVAFRRFGECCEIHRDYVGMIWFDWMFLKRIGVDMIGVRSFCPINTNSNDNSAGRSSDDRVVRRARIAKSFDGL